MRHIFIFELRHYFGEDVIVRVVDINRDIDPKKEAANKSNDVLPVWCNCKCFALHFEGGEVDPLYVSEEIFFKYGLYDIEQMSQDDYEKYDYLFRVECAKLSATSFLFCKKYSSYEVKKKLLKLGHRSDVINDVVVYYQDMEYINDERYLSVYIDNTIKNKIISLNVLCMKLSEKGFERDEVIRVAEERGFDEMVMAEKALNKKRGNKNNSIWHIQFSHSLVTSPVKS